MSRFTWYEVLSPVVKRFIPCLYDNGIAAATDWTSSLQQGGEVFYNEADRLAEATVEQCRMLLIALVRADRFSEGHLLDTLRSGHLTKLLHRIREQVDGRA